MDRRTEDTFRTEMFSCASGSGEFMTTLYNNENSVIQFKILLFHIEKCRFVSYFGSLPSNL